MTGLRETVGEAFEVVALAALVIASLVATALFLATAGLAIVLFGLFVAAEAIAETARERLGGHA